MTPELIERTQKFLFASDDEMRKGGLALDQRNRLLRIRAMYEYWLRTPRLGDKAIVDECRRRYHISTSQAYEDVRIIKVCLGNLNEMTKGYYRYLFLARCEEAFDMARKKEDPNAFARALAALGKFTNLDKEDREAPDWSQIVPQSFEISTNPEDAGVKRVPGAVQRGEKLMKRYLREIEEAEYVEVEDNE